MNINKICLTIDEETKIAFDEDKHFPSDSSLSLRSNHSLIEIFATKQDLKQLAENILKAIEKGEGKQ